MRKKRDQERRLEESQEKPANRSRRRFPISTLLLLLVFLVGLCMLLYPTVSDIINEKNHSRVIQSHQQALDEMPEEDLTDLLTQARQYNASLLDNPKGWFLTPEEEELYRSLLDPFGSGMMGYLEIQKIGVLLPIYHGIDDAVLQVGVGHVENSSLPVGGESSHCVLSGHRGLPSSRLLTDLDQMETGDVFYLHVLNQTLAYQVDDIQVVEPQAVESLEIVPGEDYCTLVTCTPYGVNTHRLLVRGTRIPYTPPQEGEAQQVHTVPEVTRTVDYLPFALAAGLVVLLVGLLIYDHKKSRKG